MKGITTDQFDLRKAAFNMGREFWIQLNGTEVLGTFEQELRQRTFARADLCDYGFSRGTGSNGNSAEYGGIC